MIEFDCPNCNEHISVPDKAAGRAGICPKCRSRVVVPGGRAAPSVEAAPPLDAAPVTGKGDQSKVAQGKAKPEPQKESLPQDAVGASGAAKSATTFELEALDAEETAAIKGAPRKAGPEPSLQLMPEGDAPASAEIRKPCPSCGKMIAVTAKKCRFCGVFLEPTTSRHAAVSGNTGKHAAVTGNTGRHAAVSGNTGKHAAVTGNTGRHAAVSGNTGKHAAVTGNTGRHAAVSGNTGRNRAVTDVADAPRRGAPTGALVGIGAVILLLLGVGIWAFSGKEAPEARTETGTSRGNAMASESSRQGKTPKTAAPAKKQPTSDLTLDLPNGAKLEMMKIKPGRFMMGSSVGEAGRAEHERQHSVTLTRGYWLGKYEVTQGQWKAVMGDNPALFADGDDYPVEMVSWEDARKFCDKLNERCKKQLPPGCRFDLPTEAQWEYACRAGTNGALDDRSALTEANLGQVGWHSGAGRGSDKQFDTAKEKVDEIFRGVYEKARRKRPELPSKMPEPRGRELEEIMFHPEPPPQMLEMMTREDYAKLRSAIVAMYKITVSADGVTTHPVGSKKPNAWGLHDMHGNVWEWCLDAYEDGYADQPETLVGNGGPRRVGRGGSWFGVAEECRSASRDFGNVDDKDCSIGFRLAIIPADVNVPTQLSAKDLERRRRLAEAAKAKAAEAERQEKRRAELRRQAENGDITALRSLAETGDANAQYELGYRFAVGKGVPEDDAKAVHWYLQAAEQGHVGAASMLVLHYDNGIGVPENTGEAIKWQRKAAEWGDADEQRSLGVRYLIGDGVDEDLEEGVEWVSKAAKQGDAEAQCILADCYAEGKGVDKDAKEAVRWYRKAAEQDDADAQRALGIRYLTGEGVEENEREGARWIKKAAAQNDVDAQLVLGVCYEDGTGVPEDHREAVAWLRKAAEKNNAEAQFKLGCHYYLGKGVAEDKSEAAEWLEKAAAQGHEQAKTVLKELGERRQAPRPTSVITVKLDDNVKIEMVKIKAGTFTMGSPQGEKWRAENKDVEKQHEVTLTRDYWLGKYEVTQAQWQAIMGNNPSKFPLKSTRGRNRNSGNGDNRPVEMVSWEQAKAFCAKLNERFKDELERDYPGYHFDLPTEAQWEYACRAGTSTPLNSGEPLTAGIGECRNLDSLGWYIKNSNGSTYQVGRKRPNAWGLYDMHGNVCEWCRDRFRGYWSPADRDPMGPTEGSTRVYRGGSWVSNAKDCRSANRGDLSPAGRKDYIGFRLALVPIPAP